MSVAGVASRKCILVIEPHDSGHHASYLRWIVEGIVERGWVAVLATTVEALKNPLLSDLQLNTGQVEIRLMPEHLADGTAANSIKALLREFRYWRVFRKIVRRELARQPLAAVIFPYLDYCFVVASILGAPSSNLPWCAISMRLRVAEGAVEAGPTPLRWLLARRLLSDVLLRKLFVINPSILNLPGRWLSSSARNKLGYLQDPAELRAHCDRIQARATLGIADDVLAVLVFGSIDLRKGIQVLADALVSDHRLRKYALIVAGRQSVEIRALIATGTFVLLRTQGRLVILDRLLDDAEQSLVFSAVDIVWLGYLGHVYMSGVLVLSGQAGLPVVACNAGEIGRLVLDYRLGSRVDVADPVDVGRGLAELGNEQKRTEIGVRAKQAFASYTPENLRRNVLDPLH